MQFVLDPVYGLYRALNEGRTEKYMKMLDTLGVTLTSEEKDLRDKALVKRVMSKWLPAADALLEMILNIFYEPVDG